MQGSAVNARCRAREIRMVRTIIAAEVTDSTVSTRESTQPASTSIVTSAAVTQLGGSTTMYAVVVPEKYGWK